MKENQDHLVDGHSVPEHVCGIDVHKKNCNYVLYERGRPLPERPALRRKFPRTRHFITSAINWCREWNVTAVAMESTGNYSTIIHKRFRAAGIETHVVTPKALNEITSPDVKQDWKDAARLAKALWYQNIGSGMAIKPSYITIDQDEENGRDLTRNRDSLRRDQTRFKNRIHKLFDKYALHLAEYTGKGWTQTRMFALQAIVEGRTFEEAYERLVTELKESTNKKARLLGNLKRKSAKIEEFIRYAREDFTEYDVLMLKTYVEVYTKLEQTINTLDVETKAIIERANPDLKRRVEIAASMPGVSENLGLRIVVEYGDVTRFSNRRKAARYTGLDPNVKESGETKSFGRIRKQGNRNLRRHLFCAAMNVWINDPTYSGIYDTLKNKKNKTHKQALCAIARKMTVVYYYLVLNNETYKRSSHKVKTRDRPRKKRRKRKET